MKKQQMHAIFMIIFWVMVGYALYHYFAFWGVFYEVLFIVFVNLLIYGSKKK